MATSNAKVLFGSNAKVAIGFDKGEFVAWVSLNGEVKAKAKCKGRSKQLYWCLKSLLRILIQGVEKTYGKALAEVGDEYVSSASSSDLMGLDFSKMATLKGE
ncbi:hypothetical protein G7Y89_g934 [Cudoniella acicularis]|uniref:Uncharacterized protein n=1 Tax=Cudoniella acicularis TaxID=354080 RepID=A0A8H4W8E9_9HELO|nr:hypothetical protein G7Y89_g934 [Cudoniella acicularis]